MPRIKIRHVVGALLTIVITLAWFTLPELMGLGI